MKKCLIAKNRNRLKVSTKTTRRLTTSNILSILILLNKVTYYNMYLKVFCIMYDFPVIIIKIPFSNKSIIRIVCFESFV
jgi:hypothetical protein